MSTPFELLRRHKKVTLAAVTGMAVLSFLVSDVANNSGQISPVMVATLVIGCFAIVGWIWGARDGKSGENAIFGGVVGLALSLVFMFLGRPPAAISAISGNISRSDLKDLGYKRNLANRMVNLVYYSNPMNAMMERFQPGRSRPPLFGHGGENETDLLITELLNREADELGIQVTDQAAMAFLKDAAGKDFDGKELLTQKVYRDSIKGTVAYFAGATEGSIIEAIRHEMRARQAAMILIGGSRMTPEDVWDIHRKLNTRQTAQFAELPVKDFVDESSQPTEAELKDVFETYKGNLPNTTAPNPTVVAKLEEGRPGLYLPRRVRLAYVEPALEEIEKQAGEVTEEEIQNRYKEKYQRAMPELGQNGELIMPDVGVPAEGDQPAVGETVPPTAPVGEKPAESTTPVDEKPADPAAPPVGEKPATSEVPVEAAPLAEPVPPAVPQPEASAPEVKPTEAAPPATEEKPVDPAVKPEGTSLKPRASQLQPVVLIQDAPAAAPETPAASAVEVPAAPAVETPAASPVEVPTATPAVEVPAAPATAPEQPAAPSAEDVPATVPTVEPAASPVVEQPVAAPLTVPAVDGTDPDGDPAPPVFKVRPLDDLLRLQIRDEILTEKTRAIMEVKVNAARDYMNDLHLGVAEYLDLEKAADGKKFELTKTAVSPEMATQQLQEYAKQNSLEYVDTPLLTLEELLESKVHKLGGAGVGPQRRVVDMVNQSQGNDLYFAMTAFDIDQKGSYAYWKLEDVSAHEPKSMDEPGVKDKVTQVWRQLKARTLAEKRAQELLGMMTKSDKPPAEALGEQTVTGDKDKSLFVTVKSTGEFSWLQRSITPSQFGGDNSPRFGAIDGVTGAGDSFMEKVFDEMQPGSSAVVPNFDHSIFYLFKVEKRTPGTEAEVEVMRKQFIESQGELTNFAMSQSQSREGMYGDRLLIKHGVKFPSAAKESNP